MKNAGEQPEGWRKAAGRFALGKPFPIRGGIELPAFHTNRPHRLGMIELEPFLSTAKRNFFRRVASY
jgi:hypothetical protein